MMGGFGEEEKRWGRRRKVELVLRVRGGRGSGSGERQRRDRVLKQVFQEARAWSLV
jgi:hypothetical protein